MTMVLGWDWQMWQVMTESGEDGLSGANEFKLRKNEPCRQSRRRLQ